MPAVGSIFLGFCGCTSARVFFFVKTLMLDFRQAEKV
jgi:hypothetical protein